MGLCTLRRGTIPPVTSGGGTRARLGWLDALRGIAALCVVFDHLTYSVLQPDMCHVFWAMTSCALPFFPAICFRAARENADSLRVHRAKFPAFILLSGSFGVTIPPPALGRLRGTHFW